MKRIAITVAAISILGLTACGERESSSDRLNRAEAAVNDMVANMADQTGDDTPLFTEQEKADMANLSNTVPAANTTNAQ